MLVLSRKPTERIRITGGIMITIVRVYGENVSIGIEAPPNVLVMRDEIPDFSSSPVSSFQPVPELIES